MLRWDAFPHVHILDRRLAAQQRGAGVLDRDRRAVVINSNFGLLKFWKFINLTVFLLKLTKIEINEK